MQSRATDQRCRAPSTSPPLEGATFRSATLAELRPTRTEYPAPWEETTRIKPSRWCGSSRIKRKRRTVRRYKQRPVSTHCRQWRSTKRMGNAALSRSSNLVVDIHGTDFDHRTKSPKPPSVLSRRRRTDNGLRVHRPSPLEGPRSSGCIPRRTGL